MKSVWLFSLLLLVTGTTLSCASDSQSPAPPNDVGRDEPSSVDFGNETTGDSVESEPSEDGTHIGPFDGIGEEVLEDLQVVETSDASEEPAALHQWSPVFERCSSDFGHCAPLGWYIVSPAYLRLTADGDFESTGCSATIEVDGFEKAACSRLPCDVSLDFDDKTIRAVVRGAVTCWAQDKIVEASLSVFTVTTDEIAPCIRWADWETKTLLGPEGSPVLGAPRIVKAGDLFHLFFAYFDSAPGNSSLAYLYQGGPDDWAEAFGPETEIVDSVAPMGATVDRQGAIHLLSLDAYVLGEDYVRDFVSYRVLQEEEWSQRQAVMPASGNGNATFTLTTDEDGRLDGLMFILRPTEEFCGQSEWAWVCELLGNVAGTVLLRVTQSNDGSWLVRKAYSSEDHVGSWMDESVETRYLYHYDIMGMGSAAFLASDHFIGFMTLRPEETTVTEVCAIGSDECTYWASAAPSPRHDGLKAIIEQGGVFKEMQFIPGQSVVQHELPWSADVMGAGYAWPRFVTGMTNTAGYQQMAIDSLGRTHLAISFITQDLSESRTLYVREYPDGQGREWQVERIEEPGVAFLMMDSKATVSVFMFNNDKFDGPTGIRLLTRRCVEYLEKEE